MSVTKQRSPSLIELSTLPPLPPSTSTLYLVPSAADCPRRSSSSAEDAIAPSFSASSVRGPQLPRADGGRQAWLFLGGAFLVEAMVWGFPFSFAIFQEYYLAENGPFTGQQGLITLTGTLSSGVTYMSGIAIYPILERNPHWDRKCMYLGFAGIVAGLVGSGFAQTAEMLVLTQGLLFSLGGSALYAPVVRCMNEWFLRRRGLAYGVITAGTSISGIVFPFIIQALLSHYGHRVTLWGLGAALFIVIGSLLPFIRGRHLEPHTSSAGGGRGADRSHPPPKINYSFLWRRQFWVLWLANFFQALGHFLPALFLPLYVARAVPHSPASLPSTSLAILNAASAFSRLVLGAFSDSPRVGVVPLLVLSAVGSGLSVLLLWGLAGDSMAGALAFGIAYGLCGGGFSSLWSSMIRSILGPEDSSPQQASTLYGIFSFGRGLGNVLGAPISTALLKAPSLSLYGIGEYAGLILFTGASLCTAGGIGALADGWKRKTA